jgi:ketosteroid isomerase-like protein
MGLPPHAPSAILRRTVTRENVEIVRGVMDAFNKRDLETLLPYLDPTVQFFAPQTAAAVGRKNLYRGHEGIRQYFEDVASVWESLQIVPQDFRFTKDCVVAIGRAIGERSGEKMDMEVAWALKLQNGKVLWGRAYEKLEEALADAGIPQAEQDVTRG